MQTLKIISSNIRFENTEDGINNWPNRRSILANIINKFETAILGTQEGRKPQIKNLESLLPKLSIIDRHRDWIKERMYPTLFINLELFSIINSGDIWLSNTPSTAGSYSFNSAFPRLCTWAHVRSNHFPSEFIVTNLHLDHVLDETRIKQIRVCINEIKKINSKNLPLVLCGDFNESPFESVRSEINNQLENLKDPWQLLKKEEISSHHKFGGDLKSGNRIDWILIDDSHFWATNIELDQTSEDNIYPSDHLPLKLTLKLK